MPRGKNVLFGLNTEGLIVSGLLLLFCFPIFWIPFFIDRFQAEPETPKQIIWAMH